VVDLAGASDAAAVVDWLKAGKVAVLNIAGPRESGAPGIHDKAVAFLREAFARLSSGVGVP
jgi:hypothetical protein